MSSEGRPLPKFGEWDVNNPASADGFTVIFAKASKDDKGENTGRPDNKTSEPPPQEPPQKKWFCCF